MEALWRAEDDMVIQADNRMLYIVKNRLNEYYFLYYIHSTSTIGITMLLILLFLLGGKKMLTVSELLESAKAELTMLLPGEIFLVRDLFKGYEWNRISRSDRLLLGTLFLNYIKTSDGYIVPIEKTSSGQQKYSVLL